MKEEILKNINDSAQLEKLYRTNKVTFKKEFSSLYPSLKENKLADFWNERLNYESEKTNWVNGKELTFIIIASLVAYLLARVPHIFSMDEDFFYPRNIGFIIFPLLSIYFAWKNKLSTGKIAFIVVTMLAGLVFINFLPDDKKSDTLILSCIHLLFFLWSLLGFAFVGSHQNHEEKHLGFLKYNGDLVVMSALILIAGGIMTAITIGLFSLIGFNIEEFYFKNIGILGFVSVPFVATYLIQTNPHLVGKVSPVIAKIFSPLVAVMLLVFLIAIVYSGKTPYNDREFLLIFNALLIGVMALIFFSVTEMGKTTRNITPVSILFGLSVLTIIVNAVALSAIVFRISEMGITPNRIAVLGSNVLILINLLWVSAKLFKVLSKKTEITEVRNAIALYLPIYFIWTIIVTFVFPLIFGFK